MSLALLAAGEHPLPVDVDPVTVLFQLGLLLVVLVVLRVVLFGPLLRLLEEREHAIGGAREQAKEIEKKAREAEARYAEEMRKVRTAIAEERRTAVAEAEALERRILERARAEALATLNEARTQLGAEADGVRVTLRAQAAALARKVAGALLGREVGA